MQCEIFKNEGALPGKLVNGDRSRKGEKHGMHRLLTATGTSRFTLVDALTQAVIEMIRRRSGAGAARRHPPAARLSPRMGL
eukprot:802695-Pyramimonas_sp.AAC.1